MTGPPVAVLPDPWVPCFAVAQTRLWAGLTSFGAGTLVATNNDAHYVPIFMPCDATLYAIRFAAANGTGNYDLGVYDSALNRIASSGSTAMTAAGIKTLSLPDLRFRGGDVIYAALALSNTAGQVIRPLFANNSMQRGVGVGAQASALPLPNPAVPASIAYGVFPWFAFGVR